MTAADYAAAAERRPDVQRAAATFRWTGSWHTVFVTPDRFGGGAVDDTVQGAPAPPSRALPHGRLRPRGQRAALRAAGRRAAYLRQGRLLPRRRAAGREARAVERRPAGRRRWACSTPTTSPSASRSISAASSPPRRRSRASTRCGSTASSGSASPSSTSLDDGVIAIGDLEIAQLANNPNFPERGRLALAAGGGK